MGTAIGAYAFGSTDTEGGVICERQFLTLYLGPQERFYKHGMNGHLDITWTFRKNISYNNYYNSSPMGQAAVTAELPSLGMFSLMLDDPDRKCSYTVLGPGESPSQPSCEMSQGPQSLQHLLWPLGCRVSGAQSADFLLYAPTPSPKLLYHFYTHVSAPVFLCPGAFCGLWSPPYLQTLQARGAGELTTPGSLPQQKFPSSLACQAALSAPLGVKHQYPQWKLA